MNRTVLTGFNSIFECDGDFGGMIIIEQFSIFPQDVLNFDATGGMLNVFGECFDLMAEFGWITCITKMAIEIVIG